MKRILSVFLALTMLLSITAGLHLTARAGGGPEGGVLGDNVWYEFDEDDDSIVYIYGNGTMYNFEEDSPLAERSDIREVYIAPGVTSIGSTTFENCENLAYVDIASVQVIGTYAFLGCTSLEDIYLPDSVTTLCTGAFEYCPSLQSVRLSPNLRTIGHEAFCECSSLHKVYVPDKVTFIGDDAFGMDALTSLSVPAGLKHMGFFDETIINHFYFRGTRAQLKKVKFYSIGGDEEYYTVVHCKDCTYTVGKVARPAISLSRGKKSFKVKWKKCSVVDGYIVQYSLKKNFKGAKSVTVGAGTLSKTVKKLKKKKNYYVRVRAFRKTGAFTYYSAWSKAKKVKTK